MEAIFGFGGTYGICTDPQQLRPMSNEQLAALQTNQLLAQAQAQRDQHLIYQSLLNAFMPAEKPLDERFADLKVRLEAMLQRYPNARLQ